MRGDCSIPFRTKEVLCVLGVSYRRALQVLTGCLSMMLADRGCGLETQPWMGTVYEWTWDTAFTYSRYTQVQHAHPQLKTPNNDYELLFDLGLTASETIDIQAELELAKTHEQSFNTRSIALQARYQCLNDIAGDPCSLNVGFSVRAVPGHAMKDVSCPYSANCNYELSGALGKEWSVQGVWTMRLYGWGALGIGNHGSPWTRELFVWQMNWCDTHRLSLFTVGNFGFGSKQEVHPSHFHGWGPFQHQSIDLGCAYTYQFVRWGHLSLGYAYRLFAHSFPQRVQFATIAYQLPFSFF